MMTETRHFLFARQQLPVLVARLDRADPAPVPG